MSLAKLFLSGLLIAGGLILGAFTLHGYFDPQWAQRQAQVAGARERPREPKAINTFQGRSRFVASRAEQASPATTKPSAATTTTAVGAPNAFVKAADTKTVAKPQVKKKVAEKPKPPPQQASVWPWNLFSN
jgi:hypothetical protein